MTDSGTADLRVLKARAAISMLPRDLISDVAMHTRVKALLDQPYEYTVHTTEGGPDFSLNAVLTGIRSALEGGEIEVQDEGGRRWKVAVRDGGTSRAIELRDGDRSIEWSNWFLLSPNQEERLAGFQALAGDMFLSCTASSWRRQLTGRPLTDQAYYELLEDVRATTTYWERMFCTALGENRLSEEHFVPRSVIYFKRLIGEYVGGGVEHYLAESLPKHIDELYAWNSAKAGQEILGIAGHSGIVAALQSRVSEQDVAGLVEWAKGSQTDTLSKVGAFELSLRRNPGRFGRDCRELAQEVIGEHDNAEARSKLWSSLFVLVDGVLARRRTLGNVPPFYRRLAALAHGARIERMLRSVEFDAERLSTWAIERAGEKFYLRSLLDLQVEPRWHPEYASPQQFRMETLGRMANAVHTIGCSELGLDPELLRLPERALAHFPAPFRAGPLEGGVPPSTPAPPEIMEVVKSALATGGVDAGSFAALVNAAAVFAVDASHSDMAAAAIREANHLLGGTSSEDRAHVLDSLSLVAASTRNGPLAEELRVTHRRAARLGSIVLKDMELLSLVFCAAAAFSDRQAWRKFLGSWLTEIAHTHAPGSDAGDLLERLKAVRLLEDELLPHLSSPLTALELAEELGS